MRAETLRRIGPVIGGDEWKNALARELGINPRNIRHFIAGSKSIPPDVAEKLGTMFAKSAEEILDEIEAFVRLSDDKGR